MKQIPPEIIEDIKSKARIEDVIGHYINVIKKGNNYLALCPFHDDSSPSLHISVDKQIFKCFSCPSENNSAGDVFAFVSKYKKISYVQAIKTVAELIDYKYDFPVDNSEIIKTNIYHQITNEAINFCQYELTSSAAKEFLDYLHARHIDKEIIEKFAIGYNPSDDKLYKFLNKKGYQDKDIIKAGLARLTDNGIRDVFYNRIMIPIYDAHNNPIGFTARTLDKNTTSKYINSADTPNFKKGTVTYNLFRAKEACRQNKFIIICEGPMDVIAFDRIGFSNAVCSLGTATTEKQFRELKRYTSSILLAFDGDKAGQSAILKAGKLAQTVGLEIKVLNNKTELDPDEIINKYGANELINMVSKPQTWIEFIMYHYSKEFDLENYSAKKQFAQIVNDEISKLNDEFDQENYRNILAEKTGFVIQSLAQNDRIVSRQPQQTKLVRTKVERGTEIAQKTLIKQMLNSSIAVSIYRNKLDGLLDSNYTAIANQIIEYRNQNEQVDIDEFVNSIEEKDLLQSIINNEMIITSFNEDLVNDCIIRILIAKKKLEKQQKDEEIEKLNDPYVQSRVVAERNKLNEDIINLNEQLSKKARKQ